MKKFLRCTALMMMLTFLVSLPAAKAETTLKMNGVVYMPASFLEAHPEVTLTEKGHFYQTTSEMTTEMLLGTFDSDVFKLGNISIDYRPMMEKGYCLDLSGSEIIREAMQNLYPVFADQCMVGDKIYAVPYGCQLDYMAMNPAVLADTGMGEVEVPDTFPEFLDFVERWVDYLEDNPENISLYSNVKDIEFYNKQTYINILVEKLLDNHILQKAYAGEPLRFNEPEVVELLKRCYDLGQRLYENEQLPTAMGGEPTILRYSSGASWDKDYQFLCLRLKEDQPKLFTITLYLYAVNARTENPDLCIEMMEDVVQDNDLSDSQLQRWRSFLYQNAELVPSKSHDEDIATSQRFLQQVEDKLAREDLTPAERADLEDELKFRQERLQAAIDDEDNKWVVIPAILDFYHTNAPYFYVPMPGVFHDPGDDVQSKTFKQLKKRFVDGQMTAEELVIELDRVAQMIEMEKGE